MPWSVICGPHSMKDRSSSTKQPMKKSWGHPQEPQQVLRACVRGELLD